MDTAIDLGGAFAEICGKIDLHIGSVNKLARQIRRAERRPPAQPVFGRTSAAGTFVTGQTLLLRPAQPGPDQGHFWYVRSIVVGGLDPTVAVTGRADLYISATNQAASLAAVGLADWRDWFDFTDGVAQVSFYSRGALPLRMNEKLFVAVTGGTNGLAYAMAVQYEDFEEAAATSQDWDI